jgi:hypothetical protein
LSGVAFLENAADVIQVDNGAGFTLRIELNLSGFSSGTGGTPNAVELYGSAQAANTGTPQILRGGVGGTDAICVIESFPGQFFRLTYQALR